ncbi:MAG: PDZ domain-containing protein [bacterium]
MRRSKVCVFAVLVLLLVHGSVWCNEKPAYALRVGSNAVGRVVMLSDLTGNIVIINGQVEYGARQSSPDHPRYPCTIPGRNRPRNGELLLARRGTDCVAIVIAVVENSQLYVEPVFVRRPFRSGERLYSFQLERVLNSAEDRKEEVRLQALAKQLGDNSFKKRVAASKELAARLPGSQQVLAEALTSADPEIRARADEILSKADSKVLLPPEAELMFLLGGDPPAEKSAPLLGILMQDYRVEGLDGVLVQQVVPESVAVTAGIKVGDVILALDDKPSATTNDLFDLIQSHEPGDEVTVDLVRDKQRLKIKVVLGKRTGSEPVMR